MSNQYESSRIIEIQTTMAERAMELLCIPPASEGGSKMILDIGCGSGLSVSTILRI